LTDRPGFFAGGDAVTGAASAIAAIAAGRRAARSIDQYLHGEKVKAAEKQFNSDKGELDEIDKDDFADIPREPKVKMPMLEPDVRRNNFEEIELGYTEEQARKEAERCLQCGCKAVDICKLRKLATEYGIEDTITQDNPLTPFSKGDSFRRYLIDDSHPFIVRDPNKCISCTLCLRVCRDVQGVGRTVVYNLNDNVAALPFRLSLLDANCESCGQCLERCPVGALTSRMALRPEHDVKTICSYCGVGCGIYLGVRGSAVVNVRGDFDNPINLSNLCVKGRFGYDFINSPERLTSPLIKRDGKFVKATWDEALEFIASKFSTFKGDQFAMLASAKCTNEENYVMQKFARGVMGTNNVDNYASLWHAPTIAGLTTSFGSGTMTNSINEIGEANCILSIGSNTTVSHPIIGLEIKKAVRKGATLIVASPRRIDLCRFADLCIQHNPGTEVALLMGMMHVIVDEGLSDTAFIKERCENFEAFKESLKNFDIDTVSSITGVPSEKIIEAARVYATNKPSTILYALDITQCRKTKSSVSEANTHGIDNVMAIANLAMLTGNIGKPSTGVNPLRGQNNAQGACDMGALPNVYTDYQRVSDADIQRKFEQAWGVSLSDKPGLTLTEMFDVAIEEPVPSTSSGQALNEVKEKIKAMYLIGENPVLSDPNFNHVTPLENFTLRSSALVQSMFSNGVTEALEKLEFLVVQDLFLTETAQYADVVLPGATFAEKDGTFTNTERRVQRIRKAIEPIGDSKPDWWIVCEIAKKMNARGFDFEHPVEIMEEIASLTPSYGGISYDRIEELGLQWPCPTREHPGTPILHTAQFSRGKGQFVPLEYKPSAELPDDEYPPLLTAEHSLYHYHTGSLTRACFKK
jgi:formate dehydrogenase alpha subunit